MSAGTVLYNLFIFPLEMIYQTVFCISERLFSAPVFSILILSVVVNLLSAPLYSRADALSLRQAKAEENIKSVRDRIKGTFKGDERQMMLMAYYREAGYKPYAALAGSVPLLLQIPFFMAAYSFLSSLSYLKGVSFGPVSDLASPDGLLWGANLLPVLMTLINLLSLFFYRKTHRSASVIQPVLLAALFLVLLYSSPAGLVIYWTLNNLFSLLRNIFYFIKSRHGSAPSAGHAGNEPSGSSGNMKAYHLIFLFSSLFLAFYIGLFHTSFLLSDAYLDFINLVYYTDPCVFLWNGFVIASGFFLIWIPIFYCLSLNTGRRRMSVLLFAVALSALLNGMLPSSFSGEMTAVLSVKILIDLSLTDKLLGLFITLMVMAAAGAVAVKFRKATVYISFTLAVAVAGVSLYNMISISLRFSDKYYLDKERYAVPAELTLSKEGKNVIVIMMDKASGGMVPYIMEENPDIRESFEGFTFYGNTHSFGPVTVIGAPALYGGYEYTPYAMNTGTDRLISEKINEAVRLMPAIFYENGYETVVCDPSYAGFKGIPDLSIYDEYPGMKTYVTEGAYCDQSEGYTTDYNEVRARWERNFFSYGLLKSSPDFIRDILYDNGDYNSIEYAGGSVISADAVKFRNWYLPLLHLTDMTQIKEDGDSFIMLVNCTTHDPVHLGLKEQGDTVRDQDGNTLELYDENTLIFYETDVAALRALGDWFDSLRDAGVYDNTRIIIVSDHSAELFGEVWDNGTNPEHLHPVLFVKDFGDSEPLRTDDSVMTNADVPYLAFDGLINDPVNPFTGNPVTSSDKDKESSIILSYGAPINTYDYPGYNYPYGTWFRVTGDFWNEKNWEKIDIP